jgi:hypothetical protein
MTSRMAVISSHHGRPSKLNRRRSHMASCPSAARVSRAVLIRAPIRPCSAVVGSRLDQPATGSAEPLPTLGIGAQRNAASTTPSRPARNDEAVLLARSQTIPGTVRGGVNGAAQGAQDSDRKSVRRRNGLPRQPGCEQRHGGVIHPGLTINVREPRSAAILQAPGRPRAGHHNCTQTDVRISSAPPRTRRSRYQGYPEARPHGIWD